VINSFKFAINEAVLDLNMYRISFHNTLSEKQWWQVHFWLCLR